MTLHSKELDWTTPSSAISLVSQSQISSKFSGIASSRSKALVSKGPRLQSPFVVSKVHFTKVRSVSNVDVDVAVGVGVGVRDGLVLVLLSDSKLAHSLSPATTPTRH